MVVGRAMRRLDRRHERVAVRSDNRVAKRMCEAIVMRTAKASIDSSFAGRPNMMSTAVVLASVRGRGHGPQR